MNFLKIFNAIQLFLIFLTKVFSQEEIIFISPNYIGCNITCSGTYEHPFDSIMNVLALKNSQNRNLNLILIPETYLNI